MLCPRPTRTTARCAYQNGGHNVRDDALLKDVKCRLEKVLRNDDNDDLTSVSKKTDSVGVLVVVYL